MKRLLWVTARIFRRDWCPLVITSILPRNRSRGTFRYFNEKRVEGNIYRARIRRHPFYLPRHPILIPRTTPLGGTFDFLHTNFHLSRVASSKAEAFSFKLTVLGKSRVSKKMCPGYKWGVAESHALNIHICVFRTFEVPFWVFWRCYISVSNKTFGFFFSLKDVFYDICPGSMKAQRVFFFNKEVQSTIC